jgi:hypothetical protein
MNLEEFYEWLKDSLHYFGLRWSDKHLVEVSISKGQICLSYGGMEVRRTTPMKD